MSLPSRDEAYGEWIEEKMSELKKNKSARKEYKSAYQDFRKQGMSPMQARRKALNEIYEDEIYDSRHVDQ